MTDAVDIIKYLQNFCSEIWDIKNIQTYQIELHLYCFIIFKICSADLWGNNGELVHLWMSGDNNYDKDEGISKWTNTLELLWIRKGQEITYMFSRWFLTARRPQDSGFSIGLSTRRQCQQWISLLKDGGLVKTLLLSTFINYFFNSYRDFQNDNFEKVPGEFTFILE